MSSNNNSDNFNDRLKSFYFNYLMTRREGVVEAALKLEDKGYIQRLMIKMMESIKDPIYDQQDDEEDDQ
ncbi:DNA-directed RNA polymerase subunit 1 [Moumouvirus australiensis]|uniref:DNA-directed RNA polymerase subunit 1 n=1 Tax=Moumouvirus australiensis TaxID=2109587 RepID=A0A2P1EKM2_9VIRU|nr:DNA-directed RNA polymerase subunit 1 [Moumouvirus australiensis]AVL94431.1 DNA-directed RNA polymerase subunit 1 [Moumouvirus australiensis]